MIRQWDHDLRGVVWAVVRSSHATDDVMQTAYEKAFRSLDRFGGRSAMKTWLHSTHTLSLRRLLVLAIARWAKPL